MELGARKQAILTAVIESYVQTGEPVGSKLLAERLGHAVSSATIRNEMAELAVLGYLEQPHTSAGRVPTPKAFRLYIDSLMPRRALSREEMSEIDAHLHSSGGDPDRLLQEVSDTLAEQTGYAALTTTPQEQNMTLRRIEIIPMNPRTVALLILTDAGALRNRVCRLGGVATAEQLGRLANGLTECFVGRGVAEVQLPEMQRFLASLGADGLLFASVVSSFFELVQQAAAMEVRMTGQLNLLQHPDYELDRARMLLHFLSKREQLTNMLLTHSGGLCVLLGDEETACPELDGSSLVVTRYSADGRGGGTIGLIGPLRMDYAHVISQLEYIAQVMEHLLSDQ